VLKRGGVKEKRFAKCESAGMDEKGRIKGDRPCESNLGTESRREGSRARGREGERCGKKISGRKTHEKGRLRGKKKSV